MSTATLATALLERLEMTGTPDLSVVTARLGLRVREVESTGFEGALVRDAQAHKGIIAVKATIAEPARKQFTIAHEVGHYLIPWHRRLHPICETREVESWRKGLPPAELEANEFAAELLLPSSTLQAHVVCGEPSIQRIGGVAQRFGTSLTATTRRFMDLTDLTCAMVWSRPNGAKWYHRSSSFPFFLPLAELPHPDSLAGRLFAGKTTVSNFVATDATLWLDTADVENAGTFLESSVLLKNYDAVLTVLWLPQFRPPDESDGLRSELDPEEFTLYRKRFLRR